MRESLKIASTSGIDGMALTPKRNRFCEFYVGCFNAKEAAIEAGYSKTSARVTGVRILKDPEVQGFIAKLQAGVAERNKINQDDIVRKLRENYTNAKEAGQFTACNQALQLEAKIGGLMTDRVHLTGLEAKSDDDLIEQVAKGDVKLMAALRELLGAPETFDTPESRH